MNFCPDCGAPIYRAVPEGDTFQRDICIRCSRIHYQNPRTVVGCIAEYQGRILMCRRAIEPRKGYWTFPSGFMENGESAADAACRETLEEACARVDIIAPLALISVVDHHQIYLIYRAALPEATFAAGAESLETVLMDEADIPWNELAFPTNHIGLRHYFTDRSCGIFRFHDEVLY